MRKPPKKSPKRLIANRLTAKVHIAKVHPHHQKVLPTRPPEMILPPVGKTSRFNISGEFTWMGEKGDTQEGHDSVKKGMSNPVLCALGPFRPGEMVLKKLEAMEYIDLYLKLMALGKVSPSGGATTLNPFGGQRIGTSFGTGVGTGQFSIIPYTAPQNPQWSSTTGGSITPTAWVSCPVGTTIIIPGSSVTIPSGVSITLSSPTAVPPTAVPPAAVPPAAVPVLSLKLTPQGKVVQEKDPEDSELSSSFLFAELLMCVSRPYVKKHESEQLGWMTFINTSGTGGGGVNYFTRPLTPESDRDYDTTRANMDTKSVFQEFWNLEKNLKVEIGLSSFEPQSLEVYNPEKSKAHRLWKPVSVLKKELAEEVLKKELAEEV